MIAKAPTPVLLNPVDPFEVKTLYPIAVFKSVVAALANAFLPKTVLVEMVAFGPAPIFNPFTFISALKVDNPLNVFAPAMVCAVDKSTKFFDIDPVPPCAIDQAVVNPVKEVIFEFAPAIA